jgi:SET family sugar efflux transporter-like MFS transporter
MREIRARLPMTGLVSASLFFTGVAYASTFPYAGIAAIDGLGMSEGAYAILLTVSSLTGAGASVGLGYLSDRIGDRRLLVIATAILGAIAFALVYLFRTPLAYIVAYCILMPFGGAQFSQTFGYARAYYNAHRARRADFLITIIRSVFAVAWVVVPPVAGWVAATYNVFEVYGLAALGYLGCSLIFTLMLADPRTRVGIAETRATGEAQANRIAPPMLAGIGGIILINVAIRLNGTAAPLAIVKDFGGTVADVGIYASLAALLEIPCMIGWAFLARRFSKHGLIAASSLIYALYLALLAQARTVSDVLWLQGFNAIATAALMSIPLSYMQEAIKGRVGLSTSLLDVSFVVSGLVAAAIFGIVAAGQNYLPLFWIAAGLATLGALVLFVAHNVIGRRVIAAE